MSRFQSNVQWPPNTVCTSDGSSISTDTHLSWEAAHCVCEAIEKHGLGGCGEIFPARTWVSEITTEEDK